MNKAERLNDMMVYLNDKNSFNLKDIMERYSISKSTALRDIQSLEGLGMPLFSQLGRNGCYGVLKNKLLSPILFNIDELFALYFSMLTLRGYESTPFHLSVEKLKQKFESCLAPEKIEMLRKTEKVFRLGSVTQYSHCDCLKDILQYAIEEKVCEVKYCKKDFESRYIIQFFDISASFGQWYATGYNFQTEKIMTLRCDKVVTVKENIQYQPQPFTHFTKSSEILYKTATATDFEILISNEGIDLFQKEHYPSMQLGFENGQYFIRGFYNQGEEDFIASYFIGYGEAIHSVQPKALSELMLAKVNRLTQHFKFL